MCLSEKKNIFLRLYDFLNKQNKKIVIVNTENLCKNIEIIMLLKFKTYFEWKIEFCTQYKLKEIFDLCFLFNLI